MKLVALFFLLQLLNFSMANFSNRSLEDLGLGNNESHWRFPDEPPSLANPGTYTLYIKVYIHRNCLGAGQTWTEDNMRRVGSIVIREFERNINPTFADASLGDIRLQFVAEPVFIAENDLQIAGQSLLTVLSTFEDWINRNVATRIGVSDMAMILAGNPDNEAWGWSPVGVATARCSSRHRVLVSIGTMMFNTQNNIGRVTRHELGHYFGSHHDGDTNTRNCALTFIMQPTVSDALTWSSCSRNSIQPHLARLVSGNCFRGDPNSSCAAGFQRFFPNRYYLGGAWSTADGCGCAQGDPCGCGCGTASRALCTRCCAIISNTCQAR